MNYLLDTCVISELIKKVPDQNVQKWIISSPENSLFLSVFTIAEINKGINKLQPGDRKEKLRIWIAKDLRERFAGRILDFTLPIAEKWGEVQGIAESVGRPLSLIDGFIAATAIVNDMILVTRNVKDMGASGVKLLNPWHDS